MLTEWRRLPYLDPGLPLDLLPARLERQQGAPSSSPTSTTLLRGPARDHALAAIHA